MRPVLAVLWTAAATAAIAAAARAPYSPPGADDAVLRFSWRMTIDAMENCRRRTAEELEALPAHMRAPELCTRDAATYRLIRRIGELPPDTVHLVRGGAKGDRPVYVLEERALPAGRHRVRVDLERSTSAGVEVLAALDTVLALREGRVQLVTLDAESRRLVARSAER
jgi:hypothetical protein